jgi:hypothetical protein
MSGLITTWLEQQVGFWSAYLLPLCMFCVAGIVLITGRRNYGIEGRHKRSINSLIIYSAQFSSTVGIADGFSCILECYERRLYNGRSET